MRVRRDKPLVAYMVLEESEGTGVIVYAKTNAHARRLGAEEMGDEWDYVIAKREKQWDHLGPHGPTDEQKFECGWWYECYICGARTTSSDGGKMIGSMALCYEHEDVYAWRGPQDSSWRESQLARRAEYDPYFWFKP